VDGKSGFLSAFPIGRAPSVVFEPLWHVPHSGFLAAFVEEPTLLKCEFVLGEKAFLAEVSKF